MINEALGRVNPRPEKSAAKVEEKRAARHQHQSATRKCGGMSHITPPGKSGGLKDTVTEGSNKEPSNGGLLKRKR
jgi:hypothetical protein